MDDSLTNSASDPAPSQAESACGSVGRRYLEGSDALLYSFGELDSVLDMSRRLLAEGRFPPFSSVTAATQTAGRGRHGRGWLSPPGGLYASLRLPELPPYDGPLASLALSFELSFALEHSLGIHTTIKWPNDLMHGDQKAGGILLESRGGALVAGIGLNLGSPPDLERAEGAPEAGALPATLPPLDLWLELSKSVFFRYTRLARDSVPDVGILYAAKALSRLYGLGRVARLRGASVRDQDGRQDLTGAVLGLAPDGALLISSPEGTLEATAGTLTFPEPPSNDPAGPSRAKPGPPRP